jgi:hypothetical protein
MSSVEMSFIENFFKVLNSYAHNYPNLYSDGYIFKKWVENMAEMIPTSRLKVQLTHHLCLLDDHAPASSLMLWCYNLSQTIIYPLVSWEFFVPMYDVKNFNITFWSHPTWYLIHYFSRHAQPALDYTLNYQAFIAGLTLVLPCQKCREHLQYNLRILPIENSQELFKWSVKFHNVVNKMLGKDEFSFFVAYQLY